MAKRMSGRNSAIQAEINRLKVQVQEMEKSEVKEFVQSAVKVANPMVSRRMGNMPKPQLTIALVAFNHHIAAELKERIARRGELITGSDEQETIWNEIVNGNRHIMVGATAGSGKTTVLVQACLRANAKVEARTYHSLGMGACTKAFGKLDVDKFKVWGILDGMSLPVANHLEKLFKVRVAKLVGLAKQYGKQDRKMLEWIVDHHDVELNGMEEMVLDITPRVLDRCKEQTRTIDYDDMIWLPKVLELPLPRFDLVMSDEAQDLNVMQQYLALRAGDRHVVVGDKNQSCYSFRGADANSLANMREMLVNDGSGRGVVDMPLTLTRRCPKSHVRLVNGLVPEIRAMDNAPQGKIVVMGHDQAVDAMKPGDMVLCRVNAELVMVAYRLLKKGIKAVVRGRDISQGIIRLIEKSEDKASQLNVVELVKVAGEITDLEVAKFMAMPNGRGEMRALAAKDKYSCMVYLSEGARTSGDVKARVKSLFADEDEQGNVKHAVTLSTIHGGKGLEAARVFILRPDLIPHPAAKQEHDRQQEKHLGYIACTRAKFGDGQDGTLVFVGGMCGLFGDAKSEGLDGEL